jgi:DNA polymerase III epsilon subunit-like protein
MVSTKKENDIFNKKPVIFNGKVDDVIQDVINKILSSPFPREEIAIIGPVKKSKPNHDSYTNIGLSLFTNLLNEYNIDYIKHYEDTNNEETNYNDIKKKEGHINLFTIHGSKGLEFEQVFLVNFHTSTFGIIPSEEKYKEFKYLWYVGLSRASYNLNIYIEQTKAPWNELKLCPSELYEIENKNPDFTKTLKFQEEIIPMYYTVTEVLNSKKMMNDQILYNLENIFQYEIEELDIFSNPLPINNIIKDYKDYSALYGMFIENIFNFFYNKKFHIIPDFVTKLKKMINNTIIIPKNLISGYKILKLRCPFIKNLVKLSDFNDIKNQFKHSEELVYSYLCEILENDYEKDFFIDCHNDVINYSKKDLLHFIDIIENHSDYSNDDIIKNIFQITLYYYQKNNETAYLWHIDFTEHLQDLEYYINEIILYAESINENYTFHPIFKHSKLPFVGELDMINQSLEKKEIVDIKFSNNLNLKHILQVLLYSHLVDMNHNQNYELQLWNFYLGKKYIIKINKEKFDLYSLLKILAKSMNRKLENMIFFYDLETTGLAYANKKIDIIERHFEEYTTGIVVSTGLIKPEQQLLFIPFEITKLTGITKEMIRENGDNLYQFKNEINEIFEYCNMPIFIAHNGNSFDHRILIEQKILSYNQCKFLDSRYIIRLFLNKSVTQRSLLDIYVYLFKIKPVGHRALNDVKMLISIFQKLNITDSKILSIQ